MYCCLRYPFRGRSLDGIYKPENFELYTTASEKRGREGDSLLRAGSGLFASYSSQPARRSCLSESLRFGTRRSFLPFRPSQAAAAYYSPGLERDYIVMQSIASEHYPCGPRIQHRVCMRWE